MQTLGLWLPCWRWRLWRAHTNLGSCSATELCAKHAGCRRPWLWCMSLLGAWFRRRRRLAHHSQARWHGRCWHGAWRQRHGTRPWWRGPSFYPIEDWGNGHCCRRKWTRRRGWRRCWWHWRMFLAHRACGPKKTTYLIGKCKSQHPHTESVQTQLKSQPLVLHDRSADCTNMSVEPKHASTDVCCY